MDETQIKEMVRARYGSIAMGAGTPEDSAPSDSSCCSPAISSCCGPAPASRFRDKALQMGYSEAEVGGVPEGANLGLGCGNPQAVAAMQAGELVIDLGSGAGFDCFLAAQQVGPTGHVIGVDMAHEMLKKARENAAKIAATNVEFRLGELEHLPVADNTADVVMSNCVINLVPDKAQVFREAFRVLKPSGRLAISDILNTAPLPPELQADPSLVCGCVVRAATVDRVQDWLAEVGFTDVAVTLQSESRELIKTWAPGRGIENYVVSAIVEGRKPSNQ
jgi:arsenite methyltransferase